MLYAFITNLTPSVVRATIMAALFLAGRQLDRQTDTVNILAVAAIVILLIWPSALFDLSFQLSFLATYAIITGYPRMKERLPERISRSEKWWARWLRDGLLVSVAAQLGALPVVAGTFYQVSWMSAAANLFIGPLVFLNTTFGVLTALTGPLLIEIARLFSAANALVLFAMIHLSKAFSAVPSALVEVPAPSPLFFLSFYGAGLLLLWKPDGSRGRRTRQARHGLLALCLLVFCYNLLPDRSLRITVLDVGQGDAIFIACPNGRTLLVDGGIRSPFYDAGARVIVPFMRAKGYRRVDTIIVTHPDLDHYGGLRAVVESVDVGVVLSSGVGSESRSYRAWREAVDRRGIPYRAVAKGDTLAALGGVRGFFLHPDPLFLSGPAKSDANEVSVVLRLSYGAFSMLLTGDIEEKGEAATVHRPSTLRSTVLKSPHHGSRSSSGTAFLNAVDPEAVAVSAGMYNAFGHPSPEVIERYRRRGAEVFRTDQGGAVMIRSDGRSWDMEYYAPPEPLGPSPRQVVDGFLLTGKSSRPILR